MRRKTIAEKLYEMGVNDGLDLVSKLITQNITKGVLMSRRTTSLNLLKLDLLTDEQIAEVTDQTLEDIKNLRFELSSTK